ncbi:hypothetical protein B0J14DRAFT_571905 [Halenospora varia]|nr:hypothetical protein B0J14DRAFT_571905 [Halenospora varia]
MDFSPPGYTSFPPPQPAPPAAATQPEPPQRPASGVPSMGEMSTEGSLTPPSSPRPSPEREHMDGQESESYIHHHTPPLTRKLHRFFLATNKLTTSTSTSSSTLTPSQNDARNDLALLEQLVGQKPNAARRNLSRWTHVYALTQRLVEMCPAEATEVAEFVFENTVVVLVASVERLRRWREGRRWFNFIGRASKVEADRLVALGEEISDEVEEVRNEVLRLCGRTG